MTLDMRKGEAASASPFAYLADHSPAIALTTLKQDSRPRVPVETLPPDHARRRGIAMLARHCDDCGYAHLFRSAHHAASYERTLPCTGRKVVLVAASFHLRRVVA